MRPCTVVLLALALLPACAQDDEVIAPDLQPQLINVSRHTYFRVDYQGSWNDANAMAEASQLDGYTDWHLVTITSADENAAVLATLASATDNCWIGLYQDTGSRKYEEPAGGWRWVTKDHYGYKNWNGGEPNNSGLGEHWAEIDRTYGLWNDMPDGPYNDCFVMERE